MQLRLLLIAVLFTATVGVCFASLPDPLKSMIRYKKAALWLKDRAADSYVFNSLWPSYPILRYYGGNFDIALGQDPVFLAAYDATKFEILKMAASGDVDLEKFLRHFPADFIVADGTSPLARRFALHENVHAELYESGVIILRVDRQALVPSVNRRAK